MPCAKAVRGLVRAFCPRQQIKKAFRVLWILHVTFEEGFDSATARRLLRQFPPSLLDELCRSAHRAVAAAADAFPRSPAADVAPKVPREDFGRFSTLVRQLLAISEFQGIRASHILRRKVQARLAFRRAVESAFAKAEPRDTTAAEGAEPHPSGAAGIPVQRFSAGDSSFSPGPSFHSYVHGRDSEQKQALESLVERGWSPPSLDVSGCSPHLDSTLDADRDSRGSSHWTAVAAGVKERGRGSPAPREEGLFPLSEAGWLLKLRWYSLLFIFEELQADLEDLYCAMDAALAKMPYGKKDEPCA